MQGKQIELDISRDARRTSILEQLKDKIGEEEWVSVVAQAERAGVPDAHHHGIVEVRKTIDKLDASQAVKDHMRDVYEILAQAEASVHECAVDDTHFHEVGNGSALLNTLLICCAFDRLLPVRIIATPVQTGSGKIECAHGLMDVPAPATAAILSTGVPICEEKLPGELCTPTSAAIIKHFVDEFR